MKSDIILISARGILDELSLIAEVIALVYMQPRVNPEWCQGACVLPSDNNGDEGGGGSGGGGGRSGSVWVRLVVTSVVGH